MTFGIVMFPGSNCDHDCYDVLKRVLGQQVKLVWHKTTSLNGIDAVILPGGFSYGDYLRTGAIARCSPIMGAVAEFATRGGLVLGICNGFQILLEAGLLPGAMVRNTSLHFICRDVHIRTEHAETPFTNRCETGQVLTIPIAHGEGNYFADDATLASLHEHRGESVSNVDGPCVFSGFLEHMWSAGGKSLEIPLGTFIATMFAPHDREHARFKFIGRSTEQFTHPTFFLCCQCGLSHARLSHTAHFRTTETLRHGGQSINH